MCKKLLIIEDDPTTVRLMEIMLERKGYTISSARNGREGIRLAKAESPHLIFLDILLPGIDGIEVLRILRQTPDTRNIPVVMVSSRHQQNIKERALNSGAQAYIIKPYKIQHLLQVVRSLTTVCC